MNSLKNLGLNVVKASVYLDSSGKHNKFAITKVYVISFHVASVFLDMVGGSSTRSFPKLIICSIDGL